MLPYKHRILCEWRQGLGAEMHVEMTGSLEPKRILNSRFFLFSIIFSDASSHHFSSSEVFFLKKLGRFRCFWMTSCFVSICMVVNQETITEILGNAGDEELSHCALAKEHRRNRSHGLRGVFSVTCVNYQITYEIHKTTHKIMYIYI